MKITTQPLSSNKYGILLCFCVLVVFFVALQGVAAPSNEDCLACHGDKAATRANGSSIYVDKDVYAQSVHGNIGQECVACHSDLASVTDFPHAEKLPKAQCAACHEKIQQQYNEGVHARALSKMGLTVSASCGTCHRAHDIRPAGDPQSPVSRGNVPKLCAQCHGGIYDQFVKSVHGKDYLAGKTDVPVCTDCHGEHSIRGPGENESTVSAKHVAATCSRCHEDMRLARIYGLAGSRLSTYRGSYHGIAMNFGMTTVANCASCHGFHDILPSQDAQSSIHAANLSKTCGKCHLGAGENFALAKIHQVNPQADNVWAFWIKRFYVGLIWTIIGGFLLFISADIFARVRGRRQHSPVEGL